MFREAAKIMAVGTFFRPFPKVKKKWPGLHPPPRPLREEHVQSHCNFISLIKTLKISESFSYIILPIILYILLYVPEEEHKALEDVAEVVVTF